MDKGGLVIYKDFRFQFKHDNMKTDIYSISKKNHKMTSLKFQIGIYNSLWLIKLLSFRKFCLYLYSLITGLIKSKILRHVKCFQLLFQKSIEIVTKLIFGCLDSNQKIYRKRWFIFAITPYNPVHSFFNAIGWSFLLSSRVRNSYPCLFSIQK